MLLVSEKLDQAKSHMQRIEDLKRFTDEKMKLFSKMNEETAMFDDTLAITMAQNIKDDKAEEIDKKVFVFRVTLYVLNFYQTLIFI